MRTPLVLAVAQPSCVAHDVTANAAAHAELVRRAGARVVVFPEMSLTGYEFATPAVAPDDPHLASIVDACAAAGSVALVGAPVAGVGDRVHIGVLAVDGAGTTVAYRKQWLGAAETARFTPGDAPAVIEVDGWRLGLAVCKDTGIAQHAADTAALGMDVYAAGVLDNVPQAGVHEERARRITTAHRVWVAMASFAGSTGEGYDRAAGRSGIWAPDGARIAEAGPEVGAVVRATLR
ncbi:carbon-nitrogen hydrolase family protein [Polymorphospora rubra]|uniref:carbon-nitrogen hydrolase family protein n=1 Tax=Polymorphospora rubra TaxID=338584 RepID=UPI0033F6B737